VRVQWTLEGLLLPNYMAPDQHGPVTFFEDLRFQLAPPRIPSDSLLQEQFDASKLKMFTTTELYDVSPVGSR
jgi:hypothetical protein